MNVHDYETAAMEFLIVDGPAKSVHALDVTDIFVQVITMSKGGGQGSFTGARTRFGMDMGGFGSGPRSNRSMIRLSTR